MERLGVEIRREIDVGENTQPGFGPRAAKLQAEFRILEEDRSRVMSNVDGLEFNLKAYKDEISAVTASVQIWKPTNYIAQNYFLYMQSDMLLAVAVILCGGIGAIISAIRSKRPTYAESVFGGLTAGFITFLVLKGGKFLFLINLGAEQSSFVNPYTAAFSGVLAGLFTDKAYAVLSDLADNIAEKVASVSKPT